MTKLADKGYKELAEYVASLREDVSDLSTLVQERAQKRGKEASERVGSSLDTFREIMDGRVRKTMKQGRGYAQDAADRFSSGSDDIGGRVKDNPWTALLIAGAVGLAIGFITSKTS